MKAKCGPALFLIAVLVASAGLSGCNRDLFVDSDTRTARSLRYYDNDSALKTTEERKQQKQSPFGMPQGAANQ